VLPSPGISEDVAILLAHEKGAELIVAVGTHFNLLEFLERNREGMSSTFFTRLKVGDKLIDARGVSSLFRGRAGLAPMLLFVFGLHGPGAHRGFALRSSRIRSPVKACTNPPPINSKARCCVCCRCSATASSGKRIPGFRSRERAAE